MMVEKSDAILERLLSLHPKIIDLSLDRVAGLLERLGRPQDRLPPTVHVAGTNGKGSVIAYLRAMMEAAGLRVQVYSSPHLVRFHERIRLPGGLIAEERLSALLEHCEAVNGGRPITFFEITTAAAFLAFADTPADMLLLEVGLGGRLDATNVVARPALSAITPISIDHEQYLGEGLERIAFEKAGILKAGVPAIVAPQAPAALEVIARRAREVGAPLIRGGHEWTCEQRADGFLWRPASGAPIRLPYPNLPGPHQVANAATAVACAMQLEGTVAIGEASIRRGLQRAEWAARLQRLTTGALAEGLPAGWELWLDGGHNAAAGEALATALATRSDRPLYLVFGMLNTKAAEKFLEPLAPHAVAMATVAIPGEQASLTAEEAAAAAHRLGIPAEPAPSVRAAIAHLFASRPPGRILICGSLYLAGTVLAENEAPATTSASPGAG